MRRVRSIGFHCRWFSRDDGDDGQQVLCHAIVTRDRSWPWPIMPIPRWPVQRNIPQLDTGVNLDPPIGRERCVLCITASRRRNDFRRRSARMTVRRLVHRGYAASQTPLARLAGRQEARLQRSVACSAAASGAIPRGIARDGPRFTSLRRPPRDSSPSPLLAVRSARSIFPRPGAGCAGQAMLRRADMRAARSRALSNNP